MSTQLIEILKALKLKYAASAYQTLQEDQKLLASLTLDDANLGPGPTEKSRFWGPPGLPPCHLQGTWPQRWGTGGTEVVSIRPAPTLRLQVGIPTRHPGHSQCQEQIAVGVLAELQVGTPEVDQHHGQEILV